MATLLFQGHGSFRITTDDGLVIYVDPYAGQGYDKLADLILVTHGHKDHNMIEKVPKKPETVIISNDDAYQNGIYETFEQGKIKIIAVPAYNNRHNKNQCVGYILYFDNIKLYAAGDTSTTEEMSEFAPLELDYALLPTDGVYNMDAKEAVKCAALINAKRVIPIHMKPGSLFDEAQALLFDAPNRLIVRPEQEIEL